MVVRRASARWDGDLRRGQGTMRFGSGAFEGAYTFASRFESGTGTNPEELIGAAQAGCFSMALSAELAKAGFSPQHITTEARVHLDQADGGHRITRIDLITSAVVPDIDEARFAEIADLAKEGCPVSQALSGVKRMLEAKLERG